VFFLFSWRHCASVCFAREHGAAARGAGGGCVCADCLLEVLGGLAMEDVFLDPVVEGSEHECERLQAGRLGELALVMKEDAGGQMMQDAEGHLVRVGVGPCVP
jgi:hypothetical protein